MREFRLLTADEVECRIAQVDKQSRYVKLLLYKTGRTDMALLDEKFGALGWEKDYKEIAGELFCGIGVLNPKTNEWIWKWDVGSESNIDPKKGLASDSFKRAGFMWGIGTELYSSPEITLWNGNGCSIKDGRCYDKFKVSVIEYDDRQDISKLIITNNKGVVAFSWESGKSAAPKTEEQHICADCGKPIPDGKRRDGSIWPAADIAAYTLRGYKRKLCPDCATKAKAAEE